MLSNKKKQKKLGGYLFFVSKNYSCIEDAKNKRGPGFESHSSQLSIWNRKTLAQNEYHRYIYISKFRYTHMINSKNKFETLVWRLMKGLARK